MAKPQGAADPVISPNGTTNSDLATATFSAAGTYTFRVTVSDGGASCTSDVQVVVLQTLMALSVSPATVDVVAGATQVFAAAGSDQFDAAMVVTPAWTVSGGGTIDAAGNFAAITPGGPYTVQAAVGTIQDQAVVNVTALPGLSAEFFDFSTALSVLPALTALTADVVRVDAQVKYPSTSGVWTGLESRFADTFATRHTGYLRVAEAGSYTLYLNSDDGSRLWLDGNLLINNDGLHGMREYSATVQLQAGYHPLRVEFFENSGGAGLIFSWAGPGITKQVVPATALGHINPLPNTAPRVSLTAPANGAGFAAPATVLLMADASDVDGSIARVDFYQGTTLLGSDAIGADGWSLEWSNVPAGAYSLTAKACDDDGAVRSSTAVSISVIQ